MKPWRLWIIPAVLCAWLMLGATPGQATSYTWSYAGDGNWNDITKWTPSESYPSSGSDTAWVDNNSGANVTVSVNGNYTVNNLKIDAGDAVSVNDGKYFHLGGTSATPTLDVAGTFTVNSSGSNTYLQIDYTSTIQGGGFVYLGGSGGSANNYISGGAVTLAADTTIQGQGYIKNNLINNGKVIATGSGLNFDNSGYSVTNSGTMTANGGPLRFSHQTITNNNAIQNYASTNNTDTLSFANSTITTTLGTTGHLDPKGGTVLWSATNLTDHQIGAGTVQMSGSNTFYGQNTLDPNTHITLANGGTLTFIDRTGGSSATLIGGDVTLDGSSSTTTFNAGHALSLQSNLYLNGANAKVGGNAITLAAGHTIQGHGLIETISSLVNHGTITAQDGTLAVHNYSLIGDGTLAIANTGTLDLQWVYSGLNHQTGYLTMAQGSTFKVYNGCAVGVSKDFVFSQTDPSTNWGWGTGTTLAMNGAVGGYGQRLEIGGEDYGYDGSTGFDSNTNFNLKNLKIGDTSSSTQTLTFLSDWIDNGQRGGSGGEAEALYVDSLFVGAGDTLNLDNLNLYVKGYGLVTEGIWGSGGGLIIDEAVPIPLPSTVLLLGSGLLGLGGWRWRRKS